MRKRPHKRRRYLVKRGLQLKYMGTIVFTLVLVSLVGGLGLYFGIWGSVIQEFSEMKLAQDFETAARISAYERVRIRLSEAQWTKLFREAELLSEHQKEQFAEILRRANANLIPKLLILIAAIGCGSIFLSHRIAGPLYRFEKSVRAIGEGDLTVRFKIRKSDELSGLAGELEHTASGLERMVSSIKGSVLRISDIIKRLDGEVAREGPSIRERISPFLEELSRTVGDFERALSPYRTGISGQINNVKI